MRDERREFLEQALDDLDSDILFLRTERAEMASMLQNKGGRVPATREVFVEVWYVTSE